MSARGRGARGFTLLELLIALAIVAALLAVAFGGLRVALAAWSQGEARAESHSHLRGVAVTLARALGGGYPYRAAPSTSESPTLLFVGTAERVQFVTQAAPFPFAIPIAFTAVTIGIETDEGPALVVRERALPNEDPFTKARVVLRDPSVTKASFQYLDADGGWVDRWDADAEKALPRAVRLSLAAVRDGRPDPLPPLTVTLRTVVIGP